MRIKMSRANFCIGMIICMLMMAIPSFALADSGPLQVIKAGTEEALEILRSAQEKDGPRLRDRREEILEIVEDYFNFNEMARRALGRPWREQPPQKREEFVGLFKQVLFNNYVDRVEAYTAGQERVVYDSEQIDGEYAVVRTRVVGYKEVGDVSVDYRLRLEKGEWKVYDVVAEGISLVHNYRSQFSSILARRSFDDLLSQLRGKAARQT